MDRFSPKPFEKLALQAFPIDARALALEAIAELSWRVDDAYRQRSYPMAALGQEVAIPRRIHFATLRASDPAFASLSPASLCLVTRATDGFLRQQAVKAIALRPEPWAGLYVLSALGDYVVEVVSEVAAAIPHLDRGTYKRLILENRPALRRLRARATSYWHAYHRAAYPEKGDYPGLQALRELEAWAA